MAILEVSHLEKQFGATQVLQDISFSLEKRAGPVHHRRLRQRQDHAAAVPQLFGKTGRRFYLRGRHYNFQRRGQPRPI